MENVFVLFLNYVLLLNFLPMLRNQTVFKDNREKNTNYNIFQIDKLNNRNKVISSIYNDKQIMEDKFFFPAIIEKFKNNISAKDKRFPPCNRHNCRFPYGECLDNKICKCLEPFAEPFYQSSQVNSTQQSSLEGFCMYKRKSQIIAFCLELFFVVGLGHFYLNRNASGIYKAICIIILSALFYFLKKKKLEFNKSNPVNFWNRSKRFFVNTLLVLIIIFILSFQIHDLIMLGSNLYTDGYGIPLISWNNNLLCNILIYNGNGNS